MVKNIRYPLFVILSGFSIGFFIWSVNTEVSLFNAFIIENILHPKDRLRLILFLIASIITVFALWILLSYVFHNRKKESLRSAFKKTSNWISVGILIWFIPILSIQAIEVYYPFQVFSCLTAMLLLTLYIIHNITTRSKYAYSPSHFSPHHKERASLLLVSLLAISYALFFILYTVAKHRSFHSYALDLGWQNQVFYTILSRGNPRVTLFITLDTLCNHFQPLYYLLAPLYALYQNAVTLLVLQSVLLASSAIPIYLIAKKRLNSNVLSVVVSVVFLLYPALHGLNTYDFHGVVLLIPILSFMLYFYETRRLKLFWLFFALALITREDTAITLLGVGAYILIIAKNRKLGIWAIAVSIAYFLMTLAIMSALGGYANVENYGELSLPETQNFHGVLTTIFTNPYFTLRHVFFNSDKLKYLFQIFLPVFFLPFFAPKKFIIMLPGLAVILLSGNGAQYSIGYQYSAHIIPLIFYLTVMGIENIRNRWPTVKNITITILLLLSGILMNYEYGLVLSKRFTGIPKATDREKIVYSFFDAIPDDATVAAISRFSPHLSGRDMIRLLNKADNDTEYYLVDTFSPPPALDTYELEYRGHGLNAIEIRLIASRLLKSGKYGVVRHEQGILLLRKDQNTADNISILNTINSIPAEENPEIVSYFTDPANSISRTYISTIEAFEKFLSQHRYDTVIIAVKGDATKNLTYSFLKNLMYKGSRINMLKDHGSYAAVIHRDKLIYESIQNSSALNIDNSSSEKIDDLFRRVELNIVSAGYKYGNLASIKINGKEYSPDQRGFNVVVLDQFMRIKEAVYFDVWTKIWQQ